MKPVKENGLVELRAFRTRVERQYALGRIDGPDKDYIIQRVDEIEARVIEMPERGREGGLEI